MMKRIYGLFLIALILPGCNDPKDEPSDIVANLNDRTISSIIIDKSNTRWIGTDKGLYKSVDGGYKLEKDLFSGEILSLGYEESTNTLWVGTTDGLVKANIGSANITANNIAASDLSNDQINSICIDSSSKIWFGSDFGLSMNKSGVFKKEFFLTNILGDELSLDIENTKINSIAFWDGDAYFATSGNSLYRTYDYDTLVDAFTGASALDAPYNGMSITDTMFVVFVDSKSRQWMGGTQGLQFHTGHDPRIENTSFTTELPDLNIHAIAEANDGKIWVGTKKGLAVFNESAWTTITNGLPNLFVTAIAFDKADGSAWIGTKKGLVNLK